MSNLELRIIKMPDRKCDHLCVYDKNTNTYYPVAYFLNEKRKKLFLKAVKEVLNNE